MIKILTGHIIEKIRKELKNRDDKIKRLEKRNHVLECIKNDWIGKDLVTPEKKFPKDYIQQKTEFAEAITNLRHEEKRVSEILDLQEKRHKEEVERLRYEINLLRERRLKFPFNILWNRNLRR